MISDVAVAAGSGTNLATGRATWILLDQEAASGAATG
jgi:hypothetical protein